MNFTNYLLAAGGFNWYGFLIGSGMVICIVLAYLFAKKRGYYKDLVLDIAVCCIPLAIVGARAFYIIFDLIENPSANWTFAKIIGLEGGLSGLAIYGGLIGAVLGSLIVLALQKKKETWEKTSWLGMADLGFCLIILGQVIGRWGNFVNQEAYGNIVTDPALQWFPYAVFIDAQNAWFQATFFYESSWNLVGFAFLVWAYMGKRKSFDGFILSSYCIWYGLGRFWIEALRSDSLWLIPNVIKVSQLISVVIFIFGIVFILAHCYRARNAGKRPFLFVSESELGSDVYGYEDTILYRRTLAPETEKNQPEQKGFFSGLVEKFRSKDDSTGETDTLDKYEDKANTDSKSDSLEKTEKADKKENEDE